MIARYIQPGSMLNYENTTDDAILLGTVIELSDCIGVAADTIKPGAIGCVAVDGVWSMIKAAGEVLEQGQKVYYTADGITSSESKTFAGYVFKNATADDSSVLVKLPW